MKKKKTGHFKLTTGERIFYVINYIVFIFLTLICIFPIYYLFINTISNNQLVASGMVNLYPRGVHFDNYIQLLNVGDLAQSALVSTGRTVIGTALMVLASTLVGYLVTQQKMFARKWVYRTIVITMYFNAGIIPWYLNMSMLGLTNNFLGYIIPAIVQPFNIILVKTYIESIPAELEESAFIDGAGYLRVFRSLILPLSKPILATIAVFGAVGHWNSFTDSIILMSGDPKLYTLQHRLYVYLTQSSNIGALMTSGQVTQGMIDSLMNNRVISLTVAMVTIIPILLVYPFMQRYFQKGIMLGAVKG
jgi:multiple sugar transport system permease protein/putative aldouronate transport system permease protein